MARLPSDGKEFNKAQNNNFEKLNNDYFLKIIQANSNGDFLKPFIPENYDEIALTYVISGNGIGQVETITYKLTSATVATLTISYNDEDCMSGVIKS